jgi:hypothetical protein
LGLVEFTRVVPALVTQQGFAGPPVNITVTVYSASTSVLTRQTTLGAGHDEPGYRPILPLLQGVLVSAELRPDGTLDYHRLA